MRLQSVKLMMEGPSRRPGLNRHSRGQMAYNSNLVRYFGAPFRIKLGTPMLLLALYNFAYDVNLLSLVAAKIKVANGKGGVQSCQDRSISPISKRASTIITAPETRLTTRAAWGRVRNTALEK